MTSSPQDLVPSADWVTPEAIREQFNRHQIAERAERGELHRRTLDYDNHLTARQRRLANEPRCTRSQMILYSDLRGQPVAIVHQYKRLNGDLGGSGKPDPKWLRVDGKIYSLHQAPDD